MPHVFERAWARRGAAVGVLATIMLLCQISAAQACSAQQQTDLRIARSSLPAVTAAKSVADRDVRAMVQRAAQRCEAAGAVRAITAAALRWKTPVSGRRYVSQGYELIGVAAPISSWRVDVVRQATAVRQARTAAARNAARNRLLGVAWVTSQRATFAPDPTRVSWNFDDQLATAEQLSLTATSIDRSLAGRAISSIVGTRQNELGRQPLLTALLTQTRISNLAARTKHPGARAIAAQVAAIAQRRARAARSGGWTRIDGSWATIFQQRALIRRMTASVRSQPDAATSAMIRVFEQQLTSPPSLRFHHIPAGAFYPVPRDGFRDSAQVEISIDKPCSVQLDVFGPGADDTRVASSTLRLLPGVRALEWDGVTSAGAPAPPGAYRYALTLRGPAGNALALPGLGTFTIVRDTAAPVIRSASVHWVRGNSTRIVQARWNVAEFLSPQVRTTLTVRGPGVSRDIVLPGRDRAGARNVAIALPRGVYRFSLVFVDGSGNRAARYLGGVRFS